MREIHRDIVGPFIFSKDNQLLLGSSHKGGVYNKTLMIPGGGVEDGETKLEAVIRETLEEVGIDISAFDITQAEGTKTGQSEKILRDTQEIVLVNMTFYNFIVRADKPSSELMIRCGDDFAEAAWYPITELSTLNLAQPTKTMLQALGYL